MRIIFICWGTSLTQLGSRYLSSVAKLHGHTSTILFIPKTGKGLLELVEHEIILKFIKDWEPDLIAFSVLTLHFESCRNLCNYLRNYLDIPIIWGGVCPTLNPELCIPCADAVFIGEGEIPLEKSIQALQGNLNIKDVPNIVYMRDQTPVYNALYPPPHIDDLPFPDYDSPSHYILMDRVVNRLSLEIEKYFVPLNMNAHYIMSSRGCLYNCNYCMGHIQNNKLKAGYRARSIESMLKEMKLIKQMRPQIKYFGIVDEFILHRGAEWAKTFKDIYRKEVGLPFSAYMAIKNVDVEGLDLMIEAGCYGITLTIGCISDRINKDIFQRPVEISQVEKLIEIINKRRDKIHYLCIDYLTDNPFENVQDKKKMIQTLLTVKRPFRTVRINLMFYEGMRIVEQAKAHRISDIDTRIQATFNRTIFDDQKDTFSRMLLVLPKSPHFIAKLLAGTYGSRLGDILIHIYYPVWRIIGGLIRRSRWHTLRIYNIFKPFSLDSQKDITLSHWF